MKKLCSLLVAFFVVINSVLPIVLAEELSRENTKEIMLPALSGDIQINEIVSNPLAGEQEWIEIFSLADEKRSLDDYTVSDAIGVLFTFSEGFIISPGEFLVVSGWGNKLNNSGDSVTIKNTDGEIIAEELNFPKLSKGESWAFNENDFQETGNSTQGKENIFEEGNQSESNNPNENEGNNESGSAENTLKFPTTGEIIMSEIVSNPKEGEEWVEFQLISDEEKSLSGGTLSDNVGVIHRFSESDILSPGEFFIAEGWKNKLNNSGDSLFLTDSKKEIIAQEKDFPSLKKGESWLPQEHSKGIPTRGEENIFLEEEGGFEEETIEIPPDIDDILSPFPNEIIISEIMSNPAEGEEWIEIHSLAKERRHLGGFTLTDNSKKFYTLPYGFVINPDEYLVISGWKSKLNNTGDSVIVSAPDGLVFAEEKNFPALLKGISWAIDKNQFAKTSSPTPSEKNIITIPSSGSSSKGGKKQSLVKTKAQMPSVGVESFEIILSEVLFRGSEEDYVELYCKKCDIDLGGVRLADDDTFFEFPQNTVAKSGEYIVVHLSRNPKESYFKDGVWHFWSEKKGLTATDETLFLLDSRGGIEDALCIANRSGEFSSGERDDIIHLIHSKKLRSMHPLTEDMCFDSRKLTTDIPLVFTGEKTGFSHQDYFAGSLATPGTQNIKPPQRIKSNTLSVPRAIFLQENQYVIEIQNISTKFISTKDFTLYFAVTNSEGEEEILPFPLPQKRLIPKTSMYISVSNFSGKNISLKDHWGDIGFESENIQIESLIEGITPLQISEVLANPSGSDSGNEAIELVCTADVCRTGNFFLFADNKLIPLPEKKLHQGDFLALTNVSLRNSNLSLKIIDIKNGISERVEIKTAKDGKSFSRFRQSFLWALPTIGEENVPIVEKGIDTDEDGIFDADELVLGSDPFTPDPQNSQIYKLFSSYVKRGAHLEIIPKDNVLQITGKTLPHAEVLIVLHSEIIVLRAVADETGAFSMSATPDIQPGEHTVDMIVSNKNDMFVMPKKAKIQLEKNPIGKIVRDVSISLVIPNPSGKDTLQETIILQNNENVSGWFKGGAFLLGKKKVKLPDVYFLPHQKKVFQGKDIPQLKNKTGSIELVTKGERRLDFVSWENAKEGQWFGKDAPVFVPKKSVKKKRKTKSKRRKRDPIIIEEIPKEKKIQGYIEFMKKGIFGFRLDNGNLILYRLDDSFSEKTLSHFVQNDTPVQIITLEGILQEIKILDSEKIKILKKSDQKSIIFLAGMLILAVIFGVAAPVISHFFSSKSIKL